MEECCDEYSCGADEQPAAASDAPHRDVGGSCPSAAAAALLAIDDAFEQKYFRSRTVEPEPFCAWSTPAAPWRTSAAAAGVTVTNGKKAAAAGGRRAAAAAARSVTLNEDEWLLRFRQPYWRAMVGRDGEYVADNGCYRCMKLRSYPDDLDLFFGPGERLPRAAEPALRASSEQRGQLQREVTRDLRRQFRLVVQGRESAASESDATATAAALKRLSLAGIRHQPIAEAEGEDADADANDPAASAAAAAAAAAAAPPLLPPSELPVSVVRSSGGGGHVTALGRPGPASEASTTAAFAPPSMDVLYELPGGSLSFLDEYTAKDLVSLSRTLSRIPDFGSKLSFSERLLAIERATSNGSDARATAAAAAQQALVKRSVPLPLPPPPAPLREAFVLADDALRVKKLSRRQDLRPVEKLTPKLRQLEDSTRLANTLAKLRYTTASGNVISLPVFASSASSRSHSASLPADGDFSKAGAVVSTLAAAAAATAAPPPASQPQSAPPSPDNKKKAKGRRAEAKGFSLPENGIQEMCLPEIAGVRIAALSGPHR